ncbi:VirD4-like conjugal transfer protein, CD1115 family [Peptoniphilus harei]|uniref:Type IV secretory system conjugative DNA transfer family protein n=1 Tax=Peptoniphilus harei TaxID=54005 RepID=A0A943SNK0_9FIRM|nr:type IV secretory system conjugative DNA transfer family protein [Peptoniphilus harei]MBS6535408.1 type IV secretory system conjugative DNA transfer family protein [Peptoniphilus harei]
MTDNKTRINLLDVNKEDLDINLKNLEIFMEIFEYTNEVFFTQETNALNDKEKKYIGIEFEIKKDYKFLTLISRRIDLVFERLIVDRKEFSTELKKSEKILKQFKEKEEKNKDKISLNERKTYDDNLKKYEQLKRSIGKWREFSEICKPDKKDLCRELEFLKERLDKKDYDHYNSPVNNKFINRYQKYFSGLSFLKKEESLNFIYEDIDLSKEKRAKLIELSTEIFDDILLKNRKTFIENGYIRSEKIEKDSGKNTLMLPFRNYSENFSEFLELINKNKLRDKYDDYINESKHFEVLENLNNFLITTGNNAFFNDEPINYLLLCQLKEEIKGVLDYKKGKISADDLKVKFDIVTEEEKKEKKEESKQKEVAKKLWKKVPLKGLLLISVILSIIAFISVNSLVGHIFVGERALRGTSLHENPFLALLPSNMKLYFSGMPLAFGFGVGLFPLIWYGYYIFKRRNYLIGKEHGSAKWIDEETLASLIESDKVTYKNNMIFGKEIGMSLNDRRTRRNNNLLIFGGSGTGKTRFEVKPNLLQAHSNYVVTDPKGDLLHETGYFFEKEGYRIRVLNLIDMENSDKYNFFEYLPSNQPDKIQSEIEKLVTNIMKNAGNNEGGKSAPKDEFWDNATSLLLSAIFYYVKVHIKDPAEQNLTKVAELLLMANPDQSNKAELDEVFNEIESKEGSQDPCVKLYKSYKLAGEKTLQSINISAVTKLSKFFIKEVQDLTTKDEINLREFANPDSKMILYVIISDTDSSFNFLVAMLYQQLFDVLFEEARKKGGRLPVPLRMLLDEFANIGKIPNFESIISVVRSRNISVVPIFQSLAQVKNAYDKAADIILDNCDTWIFLGGQSTDTTKEMSGKIGKTTIDLSIGNRTYSREGSYSESNSLIQRDLMMSDELSKMSDDDLIVLIRGYDPYKGPKFVLEEHPNYKYLEDANENLYYNPPKIGTPAKTNIELRDYIMQQYRKRPKLSENISPSEILQQRDEFLEEYESKTEAEKSLEKRSGLFSVADKQILIKMTESQKEQDEYLRDSQRAMEEFRKEEVDPEIARNFEEEMEKEIEKELEEENMSKEEQESIIETDMEESKSIVGDMEYTDEELTGDLDIEGF